MENGKQKVHPFINKNGDAEQGLTKRKYFAAITMQGLADIHINYEAVAEHAVRYSDALLAELERTKSE